MASKKKGLSSIGRKAIMALTGFFLMFFLLQHLSINMISIVDGDLFNEVSHFMGTNPLVQFVLQPVLIFSVIFHFAWGMYLEYQNNQAREVKYAMYKGSANASWMSRNMIISGLAVLAFLALHFYDFWIPEINVKYVQGDMSGMLPGADEFRYYEELVHKFAGHPIRVALYVISFVMLSLHLLHGFQSAFQSVGYNSTKYTPLIKKLGNIFAIAVPAGFVLVALVHFFNH
ncbi:succinate dehydrogenase cytochrome b subunit [Bacteroidia bacterium]|nr:succinate dehydrogenase cytochrome b subunit [Bacteroidia bacterium]